MIEKFADVLVIGSGISGMRAAMETASYGRKVAIVSKNNVGNSTKSPANTRYHQNADLVNQTGDHLGNKDLIETLCNLSESETDHIRKNTEMIKTEFGYMPISKSGNQIIKSIRENIQNYDVEEFYGFALVDLMVENNRCHGAVFRKNNDLVMFFSGSTILATGGYSNSVGPSDNPSTVNGMGISAAFRNGGVLSNPEFIMVHPFGIYSTNSIIAGTVLEYPDIIDEFGERFLPEYLEDSIRKNRYHHQLSKINSEFINKISTGGKIFLDYSSVDNDMIKRLINNTVYGKTLNFLNNKKLRIMPVYHYSLGGLEIDKNAQTTIDNMYAAGEIIGGLHGSSRLGGNGIVESLVFGKIAGENAASSCKMKKIECEISSFSPPKSNIRMIKDAAYLSKCIKKEKDVFIKSILVSSLNRQESIGYFIRSDFPKKSQSSKNHRIYLKGKDSIYVE